MSVVNIYADLSGDPPGCTQLHHILSYLYTSIITVILRNIYIYIYIYIHTHTSPWELLGGPYKGPSMFDNALSLFYILLQ